MLEWILFLVFAGAAVIGTAVGLITDSGVWWAPSVMLVVPLIVLASYLRENRGELVGDLRFWWRYERPGRRSNDIPLG